MRALILFAATLLLSGTALGQTLSFSRTDIATGVGPQGVAVADFNLDGINDIAVLNSGEGSVSILLGNGDGSFRSAPVITVGTYPRYFAVADFNLDGKPDLIANDVDNNRTLVMLGKGDGTFQAPIILTIVFDGAAVGDFNGDGKPDLALAEFSPGRVDVALGKGDGTFLTPLQNTVGNGSGSGTIRVATADLNGDGKLDIIAVNQFSNNISVLLGHGDGTFAPAVNYVTGGVGPICIALGDVNGDGKLDVVIGDQPGIGVFLGNGDGTFQNVRSITLLPYIQAVAIGDVNGDGKPDVVAARYQGTGSTSFILVLPGNGDGTFGTAVLFAVGVNPSFLALADFNHDEKLDVVTANQGENDISILLNETSQNAIYVTADSVTPSSGSSATQTFVLRYFDEGGAGSLATVWVWFNATATSNANSCVLYYDQTRGAVFFLNDEGSAWDESPPVYTNTLFQNSQCSVNPANITVSLDGNSLTLRLPVTFSAAFAGNKNTYMYASDRTGANSGWQSRGTWFVPGPILNVTADSVAPSSGSGALQTFALHYSDSAGAASLMTTGVWFSATSNNGSANSCKLFYSLSTNELYLLNDADDDWSRATLDSGATLQNSQCSVDLTKVTVSVNGNSLTMNLPMAFALSYAGIKNIYMYAADGGGDSGLQIRGTWTVAPAGSGSASSIWSASLVPQNPLYMASAVTLGEKFRSDVSGSITALRFYKGTGNNGTHIGLLYSSSGTLLAQATYTGETASGWQQVSLATPVTIAANTTYVVAYFSSSGFAYDANYFANTGVDNPPLHALKYGVDGPNGVYLYASTPQFPSNDGYSQNYWADVVFSPASLGSTPDLTIAKTHTGSFTQGQMGAAYTITVSNVGSASSNGAVTVTDTLPAGLTATGMSGSGWGCTLSPLSCIRSDSIGMGGSYPAITLTVNVASNAPSSVTNTVNVSGGGETNNANDQANDPTTIQASGSGTATSIWSTSAVPQNPLYMASAVTLGEKFRSDVSGSITALRFYKGTGNNGTHIGLLYSSSGTLLAQATYTGETASGWQQVSLATPVTIAANTTYVVAYFSSSGFAYDANYFANTGVDNPPLHALKYGVDGPNGVYLYASTPQFPSNDGYSQNYWADVVFSPATVGSTPDLTIAKTHTGSFTQGQMGAAYTITVSNVGSASSNGAVTVTDTLPAGLTATGMSGSGWGCTLSPLSCIRSDSIGMGGSYPAITLTVNVASNAPSSVTNTVNVSGGGETNNANDQANDPTTIQASGSGTATSIWSTSAVPQNPLYMASAVTLGEKFRSDVSGSITALRFYKGTGNNGTHIGLLYSSSGTLLAQATYTGETASGWQQVSLATPVTIAANTTYVVAYFSSSGFAYDANYFANTGVDNPPLHALKYGVDGPNGVYLYASTPQFPSNDGYSQNYWADVVFSPASLGSTPDLTIAKTHTGSFTQGQMGAAYTITVSNVGSASSNGAVTVTDTLPAGLTATGMSGSGWGCTLSPLSCIRSDSIGMGGSYPAITLTVNVASNAPSSVTNTVNVSGGGETNNANDQANDPTTIQASGSGTATSIWSTSAVPQNPLYMASAVTLGEKFRSDVSGSITALRFYKGTGNNGTHIGLLYSSSGTLLAQATYTGETASGWQQVSLATPVTIAANTTYVVAYFSSSGFAYDANYFANTGVDNPPLHALKYGVDGPNGVYLYASTPQFPSNDGYSQNYWADVVFQ